MELGKEPDKPFKGVFNVRIGEELHREATIIAGDRSLNAFVTEAIKEKIFREKTKFKITKRIYIFFHHVGWALAHVDTYKKRFVGWA